MQFVLRPAAIILRGAADAEAFGQAAPQVRLTAESRQEARFQRRRGIDILSQRIISGMPRVINGKQGRAFKSQPDLVGLQQRLGIGNRSLEDIAVLKIQGHLR